MVDLFIVFHISIWGGLVLCLGGLSPPKPPPVATVQVRCNRKMEVVKTLLPTYFVTPTVASGLCG